MKSTTSLGPEEIATTRPIGRRSAMAMVAAAAGAVAGLTTSGCHHGSSACSGCSDHDTGLLADNAGCGRTCAAPDGGALPDTALPDMGASGCSDSDPSDPGGHGTHCGGG